MAETRVAWLLRGPGTHDAFERVETEIPTPDAGDVTIRIRAFGLNRSELFSRRGMSSSDFVFPRVLGLECVGEVLDPGDSDLTAGERVMAMMGGMGREYDGGYATHVAVARRQVFRIESGAPWPTLGAIPETYNTAWGMVRETLQLRSTDVVLVRGGTSALGLACASIAKDIGCRIIATTRNPDKARVLADIATVDHVVLEGSDFEARVMNPYGPVTAALDMIGSSAIAESCCACMPNGGQLARGGQLGESWNSDAPPAIPQSVRVGFYRSDLTHSPTHDAKMADVVRGVEEGRFLPNIHRVFSFAELPEAHRVMEHNEAVGKLVVMADL